MSRPSSRQNPDGLATPRRDGLMSDEQEALLRSSLSLTSLSASTNRPLSPIAIRTLLQEAYKKPSTPMADDPVELGAWNAVTPRNHLPTSNQPTPQRLQASSSFQKPPLPSGGGSSSFSRPPAPASHHSMHTYPNQHRPANLYRNFIIDDADQSSPSSPKVASGHSSKNFGGAGAIRTTSAVSGAPTSDTPGKRKHSLVHSMSFTNTPSGVLHVPSYASGVVSGPA